MKRAGISINIDTQCVPGPVCLSKLNTMAIFRMLFPQVLFERKMTQFVGHHLESDALSGASKSM
jgi:hypothetical protein